jgi:hypothetical protein
MQFQTQASIVPALHDILESAIQKKGSGREEQGRLEPAPRCSSGVGEV